MNATAVRNLAAAIQDELDQMSQTVAINRGYWSPYIRNSIFVTVILGDNLKTYSVRRPINIASVLPVSLRNEHISLPLASIGSEALEDELANAVDDILSRVTVRLELDLQHELPELAKQPPDNLSWLASHMVYLHVKIGESDASYELDEYPKMEDLFPPEALDHIKQAAATK